MDPPTPMRILVVEDDADTRANMLDILELAGHEVELAGAAGEVLRRKDLASFSIIILDRRLPDATADELFPKLRLMAPDSAVIVVTGYADLQGAIAALRQGASDYILKPFNTDALLASIERVADRRRLALAKERSEAAFRHLIEAADCLIVILRIDGSIRYLSPFAEQITGFCNEEVQGRDFSSLFFPQEFRLTIRKLAERVLADDPVRGLEARVTCRDGSQLWVVWSIRRLDDHDGNPGILCVGQDITSLKLAQESSLQAERLAAIGQMVAGLAHESRNALQRSQACLEMLALADRDRPKSLELIERLQKAQDHLQHLHEDVRGYAAPIRLEFKQCDLSRVWREEWSFLEPQWRGRDAHIEERINETDVRCNADPFRMGQVFRNIFDNSLAACADPVRITVGFARADLEGTAAVQISLRDNGPGLTAEQTSRLFDPFFTTKTKGTGLGMAISRRIVEAHCGTIAVGNAEGSGAEIIVTLPRGEI